MILSITNRTENATDLGFLLHKHPDRVHEAKLSSGTAYVFYPVARTDQCKATLFVDVDPVQLVRGKNGRQPSWSLEPYVNDRPYSASSLLCNAISRLLGTALNGRCAKRPELVEQQLDLEIDLPVIPVSAKRGPQQLETLFAPLGYQIESSRTLLDQKFPAWGDSPQVQLTLRTTKPLFEVLRHLYILIPVLDRKKHYWIGDEETEKLIEKGAGWLASHPQKDWIVQRYLKHRGNLTRAALAQLLPDEEHEEHDVANQTNEANQTAETPLQTGAKILSAHEKKKRTLHEQRLDLVTEIIQQFNPMSVVDLGCGEGKLLRRILDRTQIPRVLGMDVGFRTLEIAQSRLNFDRMPEKKRARIDLIHGSLTYYDKRIHDFDVATLIEVIEHLDLDRLEMLQRVVFEYAQPQHVIVTTPNSDYNVLWESLPAGEFRHRDHRFEWSRAEFQQWTELICSQHGYTSEIQPIGDVDPDHGAPSQLAIFSRAAVTDDLASEASSEDATP